ncbi:MAG TPA: hypothetical protein VFW33_11230, partial [Gemmataceae bacterium]|nr:hypothetical protein [Gemmataceae bacterium]
TVACWAAWWAWSQGQADTGAFKRPWIPVALWVGTVAYAVAIGARATDDKTRLFDITFLGVTAFVFGMWAIFVIDLEYNSTAIWLPGAALFVTSVAPLAVIIAKIVTDGKQASGDQAKAGGRHGPRNAVLLAVSTYLTILQFVVGLLIRDLYDLAQKILGVPVTHPAYPLWLTLLRWKIVIGIVLWLGSLAFTVSSSISARAADKTSQEKGVTGGRVRQRIDSLEREVKKARSTLNSAGDGINAVGPSVRYFDLSLRNTIYQSWLACIDVGRRTCRSLLESAKSLWRAGLTAVRRLVLPLFCFSVSALLLIAVARDLTLYTAGSPSYPGYRLWGGIACAAVLIFVLLCAGSFGFNHDISPSFILRDWIDSAAITGYFFVLLTVSALGLPVAGFLLARSGISLPALSWGWLQGTNLCAVGVLIAVVMIADTPLAVFRWAKPRPPGKEPAQQLVSAQSLVGLAIESAGAIVLGGGLALHWLGVIL